MTKRAVKAKKRIIECEGRVSLVRIDTDTFTTWAVHGPDHFDQMQYWTQPDEFSARSFFTRLVNVVSPIACLCDAKPKLEIESDGRCVYVCPVCYYAPDHLSLNEPEARALWADWVLYPRPDEYEIEAKQPVYSRSRRPER